MNIPKVTPGKDGNLKFGGKLTSIDHFRTFENNKDRITLDHQTL